ncbi:sulfite exporter TauE/SafE family protein [Marinobacter nanhaiticus D15-8W]|uniref:Probable membrane transporter protein n=1 Tax=Marinobacter nanhaiticus D15-8W TaxID=626887 RepID=N6X4C5_9GAMM|nr:sulfite exporter TauE/SafE family protein [Marinobacter nanhaiticus]ENO15938.1 sulfite exporter TauE/SafE family protein [Marinobacter nanhaiticus D15-8W]BES73204.1 sulfite exporter TauE/SafE family protein [Marinobacter nanhaiticus D15-8W]
MPIPPYWLFGAAIAFVAGALRGYTGFGFAMTMALGLLWFLPPVQVVPTVLMLDILGALGLLRHAWQHADHAILRRLLPAMLVASVIGVLVMHVLPDGPARLLVAFVCLAGALATLIKPARSHQTPADKRAHDLRFAVPAGGVSGLAMSMASAGGPPLMAYLAQTTLDAQVARATAILFFIAASMVALTGYTGVGALSANIIGLALFLWPLALGGAALGQWCFRRFPPASFRKLVSPLLIAMAAWLLMKELWMLAD